MTSRSRLALLIVAVLIGAFVGVRALRTPPDGRVRIEIVAPGITVTAPDGSAHPDGLTLEFAPWLELGVVGPPIAGHLADQKDLADEWLFRLLPGYTALDSFGAISAECGFDRRYLFEIEPMGVADEAGVRHEVILIVARGENTPSRGCVVGLEVTGGSGTIERGGTELRPPHWFERWIGAPDPMFIVEFAVAAGSR